MLQSKGIENMPHDAHQLDHAVLMILMQCCQFNSQHTATMSGCPDMCAHTA